MPCELGSLLVLSPVQIEGLDWRWGFQEDSAMAEEASCATQLPSGVLLLGRPYAGLDSIALGTVANPFWTSSVLTQAAPITACIMADLAELGHAQASCTSLLRCSGASAATFGCCWRAVHHCPVAIRHLACNMPITNW